MTVPPPTSAGPAPPLVCAAHGSRDPRAARCVEALLDEVRRRRPYLRVVTSYLDHAAPRLEGVLDALDADGAREVVVLPLLLTAAYHSGTDIPEALRAARGRHPFLAIRYGETLGPHPALTAALERRLAEAGVPPGDPETAVVLAAAGSSDARANATVTDIARAWESRGWWAVVPAYASAARPAPEEAVARLRAAGAPRVAVASYLLAPGLFADRVRAMTHTAGADAVSAVLGAAPEVAEVVLERYEEAARVRVESREVS